MQNNLPGTFTILGWEIKTPKEYVMDKFKTGLSEMFIEYLSVFPIVAGVSVVVYYLIGMFSKTLAKIGVVLIFLYSIFVYLFM